MRKQKKRNGCTRQSHSSTLNKSEIIIAYLFGFYKEWIPSHKEDFLMALLGTGCFILVFVIGRLLWLLASMM